MHSRSPRGPGFIAVTTLALTLAGGIAGCGDDPPAGQPPPPAPVILVAAECPKDKIQIVPKTTKNQQGANWRVKLDVSVLCDGKPVTAHFTVSIAGGWWTQEYDTDAQGKLSVTGPAKAGDPGGQVVTVTVKGSDGEAQQKVTVP